MVHHPHMPWRGAGALVLGLLALAAAIPAAAVALRALTVMIAGLDS